MDTQIRKYLILLFGGVSIFLNACSNTSQKHKEQEDIASQQKLNKKQEKKSYIDDIPDLDQNNIKNIDNSEGLNYGAPVAVANSLIWMNHRKVDAGNIIAQLASESYMDVGPRPTTVKQVLNGVDLFVKEAFGSYKKLQYEGWKDHQPKFSTGRDQPHERRLKSSINQKSTAWLNIGWYDYNPNTKEYTRVRSNWVTLIGYKGSDLVVHDPLHKSGKKHIDHILKNSVLSEGTLIDKSSKSRPTIPANGFIRINQKGNDKNSDIPIIDGVIYLEL